MDLDYADALPSNLIRDLEEAARSVGLPLEELELLGQDRSHARAFVDHVRSGTHEAFLSAVSWAALARVREDKAQTTGSEQSWVWLAPDEAQV